LIDNLACLNSARVTRICNMREVLAALVGLVGVIVGAGGAILLRDDAPPLTQPAGVGSTASAKEAMSHFESQLAELSKRIDEATHLLADNAEDPFGLTRPKNPEVRKRYDKADKTNADSLIEVADWASSQGLKDDANRVLRRVLDLDTDNPRAREKLGYVKRNGKWSSSLDTELKLQRIQKAQLDDQIAEMSIKIDLMATQLTNVLDDQIGNLRPKDPEARKRFDATDRADPRALIDLADWVSGRGLIDDANRVLRNVLIVDPDNSYAREKLGFVKYSGKWMSHDEAASADESAKKKE